MLTKTITYTDFNGLKRTEDFNFNISRAEVIQDRSTIERFAKTANELAQTEDVTAAVQLVRDIVMFAFGKKSEDGKRFMKPDELREEFEQSAAYEALLFELLSSEKKMTEFVQGVVPKLDSMDSAAIKMANA